MNAIERGWIMAAIIVVAGCAGWLAGQSDGYGDGYAKALAIRPPNVVTACVLPSKRVRVLMTSWPATGCTCQGRLMMEDAP